MRRTMSGTVGVMAALVTLSACGSDGGSGSPASSPAAVAAATVATDAAASPEPVDVASDATDVPVATEAAADDTVVVTVAGGAVDATSTGGDLPTLTWSAVAGAALYSVVVTDADGQPFWGWQGAETTVTVGEGAPDPVVSPDMTWSIVALDADGAPLVESGPLPI